MQTNVLNYIPVLDQENPDAINLTDAQKAQVKFLNAMANYTAGQVASNLNDDKEARLNAIYDRYRFVIMRSNILLDRMRIAKLGNVNQYRSNLYQAIDSISIGAMTNSKYEFPEDTSLALDEKSIPNLISLYTYELIQLESFIGY